MAGATTGAMTPKRVYVFGEVANIRQGENPDFVRVYNPKIDDWAYGADNPGVKRYNFGVAVVNETFYVVGGHTYIFPGNFAPSSVNEQYTPIDYGTPDPSYDGTAPEIAILSPENKTYYTVDVALNFTVNEPVSSMRYELDDETVGEISGNTTLTGLSYGAHNLTVYTIDAAGNTGASETITFTIAKEPETFSIRLAAAAAIVVAAVVLVAAVGVGLSTYLKKRK